MEVVLWGVRGSISSSTEVTQFYGTNTSCVEVRTQDDTLIIFDAGSGLRLLGDTLPRKGECHLFISHAHADHTQALGFFPPINMPGWTIHLYLPEWLSGLPEKYFDGVIFPILFTGLRANIIRHTVNPGVPVTLDTKNGQVKIEPHLTNHSGGNLAYKVFADDAVFLYGGDHEITRDPDVQRTTREMLRNVHLAVVDAFFTREDYLPDWGHSACEDWIELAAKEGVNTLVLTHHKPGRTDKEIDSLQRRFTYEYVNKPISIYMAREGMRFNPPMRATFIPESSDWLEEFVQSVGQYRDESVILDRLLGKLREITNADAGTVYLVDGNELVFSYTHNDTLFPADRAYKYSYANIRIPISEDSIVGYVAVTKEPLNVSDAYKLPYSTPYNFNQSFDDETGYRTRSMLTMPIISRSKELLGVLQLINSTNPRTKKIQDHHRIFQHNADKSQLTQHLHAQHEDLFQQDHARLSLS